MTTITSKFRKLIITIGIVTFFVGIAFAFKNESKNLLIAYGGMIAAIGLFLSMLPSLKQAKIPVK